MEFIVFVGLYLLGELVDRLSSKKTVTPAPAQLSWAEALLKELKGGRLDPDTASLLNWAKDRASLDPAHPETWRADFVTWAGRFYPGMPRGAWTAVVRTARVTSGTPQGGLVPSGAISRELLRRGNAGNRRVALWLGKGRGGPFSLAPVCGTIWNKSLRP